MPGILAAREKPYREGRKSARERKSFTAKDTKDAKEEKSLTAKDAKDAKESIIETKPQRLQVAEANTRAGCPLKAVTSQFTILFLILLLFPSRPWRPWR
jgi:hypothetical protein